MKKCSICKKTKIYSEFTKNKTKSDGYSEMCKKCNNEYHRNYNKNHIDKRRKSVSENKKRKRNSLRILLWNYLKNKKCVDCTNSDRRVLQFDHKNKDEKINSISVLLAKSTKWEIILKEIEKCDIRCANCHIIRTAKQCNWYHDIINTRI